MAAHRTWGVFFPSSATSYTQLTEVAFLNAAGSDVSIGGEVFASSEYGAGYEAARAFDKNTGTDWSTASGDVNRRLWYVHPAAVDVAKLRIRCSNSPYIPQSVAELRVRWSDTMGSAWSEDVHRLIVESGSFAAGATVVMSLLPPLVLTPLPPPLRLEQNLLHPHARSVGVISDRVMFKATPTAPESPFALGRVWLLRLVDGYKAWEGWSDAGGYYTATGLELGVEYVAVGIDPYRNHKATGAGPVTAMEAAP